MTITFPLRGSRFEDMADTSIIAIVSYHCTKIVEYELSIIIQ
nr:MAG TPA: hypothetical protein [Crassvirales sp.]